MSPNASVPLQSLLYNPVLSIIGLVSIISSILCAALITAFVTSMRPKTPKGMMKDWNVDAAKAPFFVAKRILSLFRFAEIFPNYISPPPQRAMTILSGFMSAQVIITLSELGVADVLKGGPQVVEDIAAAVGAKDVDALQRVLDTAVSMGVFGATAIPTNHGDVKLYRLTAISAVLCADHPNTVRPMALLFRDQMAPWTALTQAIRAGPPTVAYDLVHPECPPGSFWITLKNDPPQAKRFNDSMIAVNNLGNVMGVLKDFPLKKYDRVIDVAGGTGGFLSAALGHFPHMEGVLFDQPEVIEAAEKEWSEQHKQVLGRVKFAQGSFFDASTLPLGAGPKDLFVLRNILHDWADADCIRILTALRAAIGTSGARLAVIEMALVDDIPATLTPRRLSDLHMLAMFGARERSDRELQQLFSLTGFELTRVYPTRSLFFVIEARAV